MNNDIIKEFKNKSYDDIIEYNVKILTDFLAHYDNKNSEILFTMIRGMYVDPDSASLKIRDGIECTCDGLLSIRRLFNHDGLTKKLISDYEKYRKYPIIHFPRDFNGINQLRASTLGDKIDYTLFDIKRYYQGKKTKLEPAYNLNNTKRWLDSFNSFEDFINFEFDNNKDLIKLFVNTDDERNYEVYDIEKGNGTIINDYLKKYSYTWSDVYYNNLKDIIERYNKIREVYISFSQNYYR